MTLNDSNLNRGERWSPAEANLYPDQTQDVSDPSDAAGPLDHDVAPDPVVAFTLARGRDGRALRTELNVVSVLRGDPRWRGRLWWSAFDETPFLDAKLVTDEAMMELGLWLDAVYGLRVGHVSLMRALVHVARKQVVHPVKDWLGALAWDGEPRLDCLLIDRFGAEDSPLLRQFARRWLIGAVARVFEPGCKLDTNLVLVGPQGAHKSSACAALTPQRRWFSDTPFVVGSKDAMLQLQGVWLVEIAELDSVRRSGTEAVKAFLSSTSDRFRPPYARVPVTRPRQMFFVGTTNEEEFLEDATGSRRFWPVRVGRVDVEGIRADREQLWAEAVAAYRAGEPWWLDEEGETALGEKAREHQVQDGWETPISRWVLRQTASFSVTALLMEVFGFSAQQLDRSKLTRAGCILARMGCTRSRPRAPGRPRVWTPPDHADRSGHHA